MRVGQALASIAAVCWMVGAAFAHGVPDRSAEAYRSPNGQTRSVSVNPNDGSCWAVSGNRVIHYANDGSVLSRSELWVPFSVSVNSADGSCWVGDMGFTQDAPDDRMVVHLGADGSVLSVISGFQYPMSVSVDPRDGSCWVADGRDTLWTTHLTGSLVHLSADGAELWRGMTNTVPHAVQVSATDGSCWVLVGQSVYHLSASGEELSHRSYAELTSLAVNSADGSCWVSWVHLAGSPVGLAHLRADGTEAWQGEFADVASQTAPLAVDPADGSCWIGMSQSTWHVAADGTQLAAIDMGGGSPLLGIPASLSVYPSDHSLWEVSSGVLLHFAGTGATLWQNTPHYYYDSVAAAGDGSCWVDDAGGDRLLHIAPDGAVLREVSLDHGGGRWPIAVSPWDGSLWIQTPGSLFHYTPQGDTLQQLDPLLDGQPSTIVDFAIDASDGSFWVSFWQLAAVAHYSSDGQQLARSVTDSLTDPRGLAVDPTDHSCWVADGTGMEVVHLAADGAELDRVRISPGSGGAISVETVALDPRDGSCYAGYRAGLARVEAGSGHVSYFDLPAEAISVDPDTGACWVGGGNAVTLLAPNGTVLWREEGFASFNEIWAGYEVRRGLPVSFEPARHGCWVLDWGNQQVVRIDARTPPYSDIPYSYWAREAIYLCSINGIVQGYEGGLYHPEGQVTRDQMGVYVARALLGGDEAVPDYAGPADFSDVPPDYWAAKYVYYVRDQGIVTGYPDGTYQPSRAVTRDQMAVFISRAIATPVGEEGLIGYAGPDTATFSDVPTDSWAFKYVEYAVEKGVVNGYDDGDYHPERVVTRDQMAVFIARAFALE